MYYQNHYREEAIQLIRTRADPSGSGPVQYSINPEAVKIIQNMPQPLAVISVAGLYRTGKSYLLNRVLLNRSDGFGVGPTVKPCTKGLWMWGKPIVGRTKNNQLVHVLIIDSEGFGAVYQDVNHDARIFALTLLLSSCFIYNSVGSIDETAVQNLGLVTNITKSIKQKNNEGQEFADSAPQFYWVLRDFSLELTASDGRDITAKQYMEKALDQSANMKEDKARVRQTLTQFFNDRDCITLIRPLTCEQSLQELDKMDFDQLRPEFVKQILAMRKKVLDSLCPKKFFGKVIDGEIFCQIVEQYVQIINGGSVCNLLDIWTYISKNECQKAKEQAVDSFSKGVEDRLVGRIPMSAAEIDHICAQIHRSTMAQYKKQVQNFENAHEAEEQLEEAIKDRIKQIKAHNQAETKKEVQRNIELEFGMLDRKLKANDFRSIAEFIYQIDKAARQFKKRNAGKGIVATSSLNQYLYNKMTEGSDIIFKELATQTDKVRTTLKQLQRKSETDSRQWKNQTNSLKASLAAKTNSYEAQKMEWSARAQNMKEALKEAKQDKERLEQTIQNEYKRDKNLATKAMQDIKTKLAISESKNQELEKKLFFVSSQNEKKEALLNQRLEFQEKAIEDYKKKLSDMHQQAQVSNENWQKQYKDLGARSQAAQKTLQKRLTEVTERLAEEEAQMQRQSEQHRLEADELQRKVSDLVSRNEELERSISKLQIELQQRQTQLKAALTQKQTQQSKASQKLASLQETIRDKEETIRSTKIELNKQRSILQQKQEFYEQEVQTLKARNQEALDKHESLLKLFESKETHKNEMLAEIRGQYAQQLQEVEKTAQIDRKQLRNQLAMTNMKMEELEMTLQKENQDLKRELAMAAERYEVLEQAKTRLYEQGKQAESDRQKNMKALEQRHSQSIAILENQIHILKEQATQEAREAQQKNEDTLSQLKNFYQLEKQRLQKRLLESQQKYKELAKQDLDQKQQEHQLKIAQYERHLQDLTVELRQAKMDFRNSENELQCKLAVLTKETETLKEQKKQLKELVDSSRVSLEEQHQSTVNTLKSEKSELQSRVENLTAQLHKKEKQIYNMVHKKETLETNLAKKESSLETLKDDYETELRAREEELDKLKEKLAKINDTHLNFKLDAEKQLALTKQENDFLKKRIGELTDDREKERSRYDQRLAHLKSEIAAEYKDKLEKAQSDYAQLQDKMDKFKKTSKDQQNRLSRQITTLEKDKVALQDRINMIDSLKSEAETSQLLKVQHLQSQISDMKEEAGLEKSKLLKEIERLKQVQSQLEQAKSEVQITYEKDKVLWQNKIQFVESQREQAKLDLSEAIRKFEVSFSTLNKDHYSEEGSQETAKIQEQKYNTQLENLKEKYQRKHQDSEERIRSLQSELKSLKALNNELKTQKQMNSQRQKLQMMQYSELSQMYQLRSSSEQYDREKSELQQKMLKMREDYTRRTMELEKRNKELQTKFNASSFSYEKEYVKWNIDRKTLQDKVQELLEANQKLLKQIDRPRNKEKEVSTRTSSRITFRLQ